MTGPVPAPAGPTSPRVALFVTCVVDVARPDAGVAAVHLLRAAGAEVTCPRGQTCCGQPAWNAGFADEAVAVARTSLGALEADPADLVVVPAGSCATMMRRYWPQLFALAGRPGEADRAQRVADRVRELSEFLGPYAGDPADADADPAPPSPGPGGLASEGDHGPGDPPPPREEGEGAIGGPGPRLAYHRSCHLERELHVTDAPVRLLHAAGVPPAEWEGDDRCCGFGGTFSVRLPEVSVAMADEKLDHLPDGVDTVVSCDASCLLHLEARARERGLPLRFRHLAEELVEHLPDAPTADGPTADGPPAASAPGEGRERG
ncbi:MAG: (Fe-S)-binding protein [Acidimicrobiales bacterium]|nr:(Fe-S)-binding protein [Acidimicrobiales bacterium]